MTTEPLEALRGLAPVLAYDRTSVERFVFAARAVQEDVERDLARAQDRAAAAEARLAGVAGLERLLAATLVEAQRALAMEERESQAAFRAILEEADRHARRLVLAARADAAALRAASARSQAPDRGVATLSSPLGATLRRLAV